MSLFFPLHWPHHHRHHYQHIVLYIDGVGIILHPEQENKIMTTVAVGHTIAMSIAFLDQNGNPMLAPTVPDAPPTWTNTTPATETIVPAADGLSCVATAVAAGSDTVNLSATIGGKAFTASLSVTVDVVQVLSSIAIKAVVT